MSTLSDNAYAFVLRGLLSEEALDRAGRRHPNLAGPDAELAELAALDALDEEKVAAGRRMAVIYTAISAFEMSARKLVESVLADALKDEWWEKGASADVRRRAENRMNEEAKVKWHGQRGGNPIDYTELGDLSKIIRQQWPHFEAFIPSVEWAASILSVLERSRNVIMHSGELSREDIARVGINIRDWTKQVGT